MSSLIVADWITLNNTHDSAPEIPNTKHYGIIYHIHHPCLLLIYINSVIQIICIKCTT